MAAMQFWGVEVKAKEPNKVILDEGRMLHLSQATLGNLKKDNEPVIIHVKVDDKKFVLGVLNQATPQLSFDLVFDQEFEISHNWKNGSVHFLGYSTDMPEDDEFPFDDSDEEEAAIPFLPTENGKPGAPAQDAAAKPEPAGKAAKDNKPKPQEKDDSEDDSDDDEDDSEDGESDEDSDDDSDDDSDGPEVDYSEDDLEDEKTTKPESGKKRPIADAKTPEAKKAKLVTPQKTDGKKVVHSATPHPSKKVAKTSGGDKSTPKSGGQFSCEPCKKAFNSDNALQSHNKAKHAGK